MKAQTLWPPQKEARQGGQAPRRSRDAEGTAVLGGLRVVSSQGSSSQWSAGLRPLPRGLPLHLPGHRDPNRPFVCWWCSTRGVGSCRGVDGLPGRRESGRAGPGENRTDARAFCPRGPREHRAGGHLFLAEPARQAVPSRLCAHVLHNEVSVAVSCQRRCCS